MTTPEPVRRKRKSRRRRRKQQRQMIAGGVGLALVLTVVGVLATRPSSSAGPTLVLASATPSASPAVDVEPVLRKLRDPSRPFVLTVLGDSTGNDRSEWVLRTAERLAEQRRVVVRTWDLRGDGYAPPVTLGSGGQPLTVYNGSAPGRGSEYPLQVWPAMVPQAPDLVIVNHGHNDTPSEAYLNTSRILERVRQAHPGAAVMLTAQNPEAGVEAEEHEEVVRRVRVLAQDRGLRVIDAHAAFVRAGGRDLLLDEMHPTPEGGWVWAEEALRALAA